MTDPITVLRGSDGTIRVGPLLAYQSEPGCQSMMCRRDFSDGMPGVCAGWHCGNCHQPSSQYGHFSSTEDGFTCQPEPALPA